MRQQEWWETLMQELDEHPVEEEQVTEEIHLFTEDQVISEEEA